MRITRWLAGAALALVTVAGGAVPAAYAQNDDENPWVKLCNRDQQANKELCLVTQELRTDSGQFLASLAIRETPGEARKSLLISVPVGMLIRAAVRLQVDGAQETQVPFTICFPNACYAELAIDESFITKLKAGGKLQITTMNQQAKPVRFDMTLIGFTAAYDGQGVDPLVLQERQQNLQAELERRAQEARDRLVAEQRKALEDAN